MKNNGIQTNSANYKSEITSSIFARMQHTLQVIKQEHVTHTQRHGNLLLLKAPLLQLYPSELEKKSYTTLHRHDFFEIVFVIEGTGTHIIDKKRHPVAAGDMLFINPRHNHQIQTENKLNLFYICIHPSLLDLPTNITDISRDGEAFYLFEPFFRRDDKYHGYLALKKDASIHILLFLEHFFSYCYLGAHDDRILLSGFMYFYQILLDIYHREIPAAETEQHRMQELFEYINSHYADSITLADIAHKANLSPNYISRAFRKAAGRTLTDYVHEVRIKNARELIGKTDFTLTRIAYEVGFSDYSNFYRVFKRHTGNSPRHYASQKNDKSNLNKTA